MFTGNFCETQVESSGSFSMFLFIFLVALVIVGIVLLRQSDNIQSQVRQIVNAQN
jgi:hypothetical protein